MGIAPTEDRHLCTAHGHYEILSILGRGGTGVVLKAFDARLDLTVAVKVLTPQFAANTTARQRFVRDAKAIAAVSHEHIVAVHAVSGDDEPYPYIVMQLVQGTSLQDRLDRTGPFALREILRVGWQTASGLAAAHAQGLVHRDIKPANILLESGTGQVKITDFGLARAVDDANVTQSGMVVGTPHYMSPEQAEGEPVDPRSDLFSLGSVLYALATGHPPFRANGLMAVMRRVIVDTPRPLRASNETMPAWLEAIVAKLLAKNPNHRFQTATQLAQLLKQHLAHLQRPRQVPLPPPVQGPPEETRVREPQSTVPTQPPAKKPSMPSPEGQRAKLRRYAKAAGVAVLLAILQVPLLYYGPTLLGLARATGQVTLQSNDPQIRLQIFTYGQSQLEKPVAELTAANPKVTLPAGDYQIHVFGISYKKQLGRLHVDYPYNAVGDGDAMRSYFGDNQMGILRLAPGWKVIVHIGIRDRG